MNDVDELIQNHNGFLNVSHFQNKKFINIYQINTRQVFRRHNHIHTYTLYMYAKSAKNKGLLN